MLAGLVQRRLLVEDSFNGSNHRLKAVHAVGEGFMWLVVTLLLLRGVRQGTAGQRLLR